MGILREGPAIFQYLFFGGEYIIKKRMYLPAVAVKQANTFSELDGQSALALFKE